MSVWSEQMRKALAVLADRVDDHQKSKVKNKPNDGGGNDCDRSVDKDPNGCAIGLSQNPSTSV